MLLSFTGWKEGEFHYFTADPCEEKVAEEEETCIS